jgi:hypothetical protein
MFSNGQKTGLGDLGTRGRNGQTGPASSGSKTVLASKVVSVLKSTSSDSSLFKPIELVTAETLLRDDMVKNPWLYQLFNTVINECVQVSALEAQKYGHQQNIHPHHELLSSV